MFAQAHHFNGKKVFNSNDTTITIKSTVTCPILTILREQRKIELLSNVKNAKNHLQQ